MNMLGTITLWSETDTHAACDCKQMALTMDVLMPVCMYSVCLHLHTLSFV